MLFALAFSFGASLVPHVELPATFIGNRAFAMPRVAGSTRRLALWLDSDGSGFLRSGLVESLHLQQAVISQPGGSAKAAYLPALDQNGFPPVTGDRGALPILNDADANNPIYAGIDGQLGWSWFTDRIWTIDYVGHHLYRDLTSPPFRSADAVPLTFDRDHRYPRLELSIDGKTYRAALDTAATVALPPRAVALLNDGLPAVRATSFIPQRVLAGWHVAHPDWPYVSAAAASGNALIRVPVARASRVTFHDVWFSSRPNDDVFRGNPVDIELGPTAYWQCAVTIDYVHDVSAFECRA